MILDIYQCLLIICLVFEVIYIIDQRKAFYKQRIADSSCARKETVDIGILVTSSIDDKKIMRSMRKTIRPPSIIKNWNQLSQYNSCKIVKKIHELAMRFFWPEVIDYVSYFMNLGLNSTQKKIYFE